MKNLNFNKTYTPITHYTTIKLLFTITTTFNLKLQQLNINTTFLHNKLTKNKKIYITPPPNFKLINKTIPTKIIIKLLNSLYNLKQTSHIFHINLTNKLTRTNYTQLITDNYKFYKTTNTNNFIVLVKIINNILNTYNNLIL